MAFEENPDESTPTRKVKRISLPVGDDGRIDWDRTRLANKQAFVDALENDDHALGVLGLEKKKDTGPAELEITEDHVKKFIDIYGMVCGFAIPAIVKVQSKGKIAIPRPLAARVYVYNDDQKNQLAPPGAQWANENLPVWVKEWIAKIGPGAEFFGGLAVITYMQTQQVMTEYMKSQKQDQPEHQPVNGKVVEEQPV